MYFSQNSVARLTRPPNRNSLLAHRTGILALYDAKATNALVEGIII